MEIVAHMMEQGIHRSPNQHQFRVWELGNQPQVKSNVLLPLTLLIPNYFASC